MTNRTTELFCKEKKFIYCQNKGCQYPAFVTQSLSLLTVTFKQSDFTNDEKKERKVQT